MSAASERQVLSAALFQPATVVAERLRRREISSRELTEDLLARIDAVNPALNAVVEVRPDQALRAAADADARLARGEAAGPLHGVPMTIKESFHVSGFHTTWGNPAFAGYVADRDATVVRRLRQAGAIIIGTTNVPFMLSDFGHTANEVYGTTSNPWDTARSPGGSTGGAAAALAAGLTFLEYGSDLVGSVRIPAAFCGVYGLKPSVSTVPLAGFQPPGPPADPGDMLYMSSLGPLARSAGDLRTALRATAGPDGPAAKAYSWELPAPRHTRLADFRVGVVLDHESVPVSSEVGAVMSDAVNALARAGAKVVEGWPDGIDPVREAESFGFQVGLFFAFQQAGHDSMALADVVEQENRRMAARAAWARYFAGIDVFLCPVNFTPAYPHGTGQTVSTPEGERPYNDQAFWISHPSLPGLPAVCAPIGRTQAGLPVGLQVVGPGYEDDTAITFAELAGDIIGGYEQPPI